MLEHLWMILAEINRINNVVVILINLFSEYTLLLLFHKLNLELSTGFWLKMLEVL